MRVQDLSTANIWAGLNALRGENTSLTRPAYYDNSKRRNSGEATTNQRAFSTDVLHRVVGLLAADDSSSHYLSCDPSFLGNVFAKALKDATSYLKGHITKILEEGDHGEWIKRCFLDQSKSPGVALAEVA